MVCARTPLGLAGTGARSAAEAGAGRTAKPRVAARRRAQGSASAIPEKEGATSARWTPAEWPAAGWTPARRATQFAAARRPAARQTTRAASAGRFTRAARAEAVISHVVLFKPKPDLTAADREALVAAFEYAVSEIPDVRGVRVGRRVTHGAGYETSAPDLADALIVIDFDDVAGLQAYLGHPAHAGLGARFGQALSSGLIYDFEVGELRTIF
jgi:hypothetical protein